MTELTREQIEALRDGATPGPYECHDVGIYAAAKDSDALLALVYARGGATMKGNRDFFAAAPDLADTALAAMAERDALRVNVAMLTDARDDLQRKYTAHKAEIADLRAQLATARAETWEVAAQVAESIYGGATHIPYTDGAADTGYNEAITDIAAALRAMAKEARDA